MATVTEVREWMDKQIEARKMMHEELVIRHHDFDLDDTLKNFSRSDSIHMGSEAVRYISDLLKLDLCVKARPRDTDYPYEIFVIYKGEVFFALESEAEYRERGAVV